MVVPVSDPGFWNDQTVKSHLIDTLAFASDDDWDFTFTQALPTLTQLPFASAGNEKWAQPDLIVMLSGGSDSLCATVEAISDGARPLLVSHRSAPVIGSRQQSLVKALR